MAIKRISAALLFMLFSATVWADLDLTVKNPWIREAPPTASTLAGYMTIVNNGDKAVNIVEASSPDFKSVQIHSVSMDKGMMHMQHMHKLHIPAKGQVELKPGSMHLMLMSPKKPLKLSDQAVIVLKTDSGKMLELFVPVKKP